MFALTAIGLCALGLALRGANEIEQDRVARAYELASDDVRSDCKVANLPYPPKRIFVRVFKDERELEVWGAGSSGKFKLVQTYPIAAMSGSLGPKRREGDRQAPEGFYHVDRFNPRSQFRLSLGLNYPNTSDRKRSDRQRPGGDIFIHGDRKSIGCFAMTDEKIDQIYILALEARNAGQARIPVHCFPFRMTHSNLRRFGNSYPQFADFWAELEPIYQAFEKARSLPKAKIDADGAYRLLR